MSNSCIPRNELVLSERVRRLEQSLPQIDDTPYVIGFMSNGGNTDGAEQLAATLIAMDADWYLWAGGMVPLGTSPVTEAAVITGFAPYLSFANNKSTRCVQEKDVDGDAGGTETTAAYPSQFPSPYFKRSLGGGRVAVFVVNTADDDLDFGGTQADWLTDQIFSSSEPWKIVMMGSPPRTSVSNGTDVDSEFLYNLHTLGVHLLITGTPLANEHLNVWGLNLVNNGYTTQGTETRAASIQGEVHNDSQIVWPTTAQVGTGEEDWFLTVGKITVERDRMFVEFMDSETGLPVYGFAVERDTVALTERNSCCPTNTGGGGGNLTWEDEEAREAVAPDFVGQLGVQQDDGTIWIATGIGEGDWTLYECTQVFADAAARGSAVPTKIGQLGVQLDTNVVYRATGTSAGNWTAISSNDTQTFADAAARGAATPNRIGQLGYQTDTNTLWKGTAVVAGSWSLVQETLTWSNDAARAALVPRFTGQLGIQLDTGLLYRSTGTSAGNWTSVEISQPDVVFLESTGNDSTGLTGYQSRPFLTASGALTAAAVVRNANRNVTVKVGNGTFSAGNWTDTGGTGRLTIVGNGESNSSLILNQTGHSTVRGDKSVTVNILPNGFNLTATNSVLARGGSFGDAASLAALLTVSDCRLTNKIDAQQTVADNCIFQDLSFSGDASAVTSYVVARNCSFNALTGGTNEGATVDLNQCQANGVSGRMSLTARNCSLGTSNVTGCRGLNIYDCTATELTVVGSTTVNTGMTIYGLSASGLVDLTVNYDGGVQCKLNSITADEIVLTIAVTFFNVHEMMNNVSPDISVTTQAAGGVNLYNCTHWVTEVLDTGVFNTFAGITPNGGPTGTGTTATTGSTQAA